MYGEDFIAWLLKSALAQPLRLSGWPLNYQPAVKVSLCTLSSILTPCGARCGTFLSADSLTASTWAATWIGNYSGDLSMTSFFNTNLSNLSNFAERLPEGTIRFVLCTNLANDSNAMRTANLVSIRVIRGVFLTRIFRISRMQWGPRTWSAFV